MSDYNGYFKRYGRSEDAPTSALVTPVSKSWLFEIVNIKSNSYPIVESFTLLLPPTGITIKQAQRVSITKTFGNAFVDDYGHDNLQITLKGFTGTSHLFPTFTTTADKNRGFDVISDDTLSNLREGKDVSSSKGYTGKDAFYTFQKKIMRYKDNDNWANHELYVYDLADGQAYKCVLLDFTLDRQAAQPLNRYPYTISLFVYERLDKSKPKHQPIVIYEEPDTALDDIEQLFEDIKAIYKDVKSIIDGVSYAQEKLRQYRTQALIAIEDAADVLTSPLSSVRGFLETTVALAEIPFAAYKTGKMTIGEYAQAREMITETVHKAARMYGFEIAAGRQKTKTVRIPEYSGMDVSGPAPKPKAASRDYTFSGFSSHTVRGGDTIQSIAKDRLGDESLWPFIAAANKQLPEELEPGETLFIPVQKGPQEESSKDLYIFTEDLVGDPYGTDIRLDTTGDIAINEQSDVDLISGTDNVKQAVDLRLNTYQGSMIKQSAYGIRTGIGLAGSTMALNYMKMAVRSTLSADARIESVNNLIINVESDTVYMSMDIKLSGADTTLPVSTVL